MQLLQILKALSGWLTTDLANLGRAAPARTVRQKLPEAIQAALSAETLRSRADLPLPKAADFAGSALRSWPSEQTSQQPDNPAIRLIEVLSALPPAQLPPWFKQRFAGEPLFELREFRELPPAQRRQVLVLIEKTLSARPVQVEAPVQDDMRRFLQAARQI